jgi:hypothetical protein
MYLETRLHKFGEVSAAYALGQLDCWRGAAHKYPDSFYETIAHKFGPVQLWDSGDLPKVNGFAGYDIRVLWVSATLLIFPANPLRLRLCGLVSAVMCPMACRIDPPNSRDLCLNWLTTSFPEKKWLFQRARLRTSISRRGGVVRLL